MPEYSSAKSRSSTACCSATDSVVWLTFPIIDQRRTKPAKCCRQSQNSLVPCAFVPRTVAHDVHSCTPLTWGFLGWRPANAISVRVCPWDRRARTRTSAHDGPGSGELMGPGSGELMGPGARACHAIGAMAVALSVLYWPCPSGGCRSACHHEPVVSEGRKNTYDTCL